MQVLLSEASSGKTQSVADHQEVAINPIDKEEEQSKQIENEQYMFKYAHGLPSLLEGLGESIAMRLFSHSVNRGEIVSNILFVPSRLIVLPGIN